MKNLRAAAGQRIHARFFHLQQRVANRKLREARVVVHLDHRERLQVHLRKALLQAANQLEVILERQIGMQAADDVKFRGAFGDALRGARDKFRRAQTCKRRARPATGRTRTACSARRRRSWD